MLKVVKEIIIMLLACLVAMLIFAVIFYEYIPSRKVIPEVATYEPNKTVKDQLADDIDQRNDNIITSFDSGTEYEVTARDLNGYQAVNEYIPGKSNPFAYIVEEVDGEVDGNSTSTNTTSNSGSSSTSKNASTSTNENTTYYRNTGTK